MTIKAVVFDLDGLMFNTEEIFNHTGHELLRRRGKTMTDELLTAMMGRRPDEAFTQMINLMQLDDSIEELKNESRSIFESIFEEMLAPMTGLYELLEHIEQHQLPKAVATSAPRDYLHNILGRFELRERFLVTLTAEDVTQGKPHPEIYLRAAEMLEISPQQMLVLEDSQAGTHSAAAAGAVVVSIPHEHSRNQDFSPATHVADALNDELIFNLIAPK